MAKIKDFTLENIKEICEFGKAISSPVRLEIIKLLYQNNHSISQIAEEGWGYGNKVNTKEDFLKRFDSITTAIKEIPYVCGYCYTQVTENRRSTV